MPSFKITLAYDGTDFVGWQRQATGVSVQGLLEEALRELDQRGGDGDGCRSDRCWRPRARAGGGVLDRAPIDCAGGDPCPQRAAARRGARAVGGSNAGNVPRPFRCPREDVSLPDLERRRRQPLRAPLRLARAGRARSRRHADRRAARRRRARFRGVPVGGQRCSYDQTGDHLLQNLHHGGHGGHGGKILFPHRTSPPCPLCPPWWRGWPRWSARLL